MWRVFPTLLIGLTIFMYVADKWIRDLIFKHNKDWKIRMEKHINNPNRHAIQERIFADLTFTIKESFTLLASYNILLMSLFMFPNQYIIREEYLLLYIVNVYGILYTFIGRKNVYYLTINIAMKICTLYLCLKLLDIDLLRLLRNIIFA